jgi:FkbM family methyltransferase
LVGNNGQVYAFEPNPNILTKLKRNLALNGINNVIVFPYAVSDHAAEREIYLGQNKNSGLTSFRKLEKDSSTLNIRTICLDEFALENRLRSPDFIKLDVEGAEYLALSGMSALLSTAKQIKVLMEISDHFLKQVAGDEASLLEKAKQYGFSEFQETSRHSRILEDGKPLQYMLYLRKEGKV